MSIGKVQPLVVSHHHISFGLNEWILVMMNGVESLKHLLWTMIRCQCQLSNMVNVLTIVCSQVWRIYIKKSERSQSIAYQDATHTNTLKIRPIEFHT